MAMSREKIGQEKKSFGVALRRFRTEKLHISTVNEMAVKMGVSKDIYANWELGRSSPEPFQVIALLQLSPPEWLREFGLDIAKLGDQYPSPQVSSWHLLTYEYSIRERSRTCQELNLACFQEYA
jgi:transcriptional regulator with XRE-family HTH domain